MNEVRLPAEWEAHDTVLVAWPHRATDWAYMLDEVQYCVRQLVTAVAQEERVLLIGPRAEKPEWIDGLNVTYLDVPSNDTWTRDYGPISLLGVADCKVRSVLDFKFNGWGLKFAADRDNLVTSYLTTTYNTFAAPVVNRLSFVLEGGSIESDGKGTIMTTSRCLLSPNRNGGMDADEIEHHLKTMLGANRVLWLAHGAIAGDDTDGHIDTLARFAPNDTIVYVGCRDTNHPDHCELQKMREELKQFRTSEGLPYRLLELPEPSPIFDEQGGLLPATYANFLVTPRRVLMPTYGDAEADKLASQILAVAYEGREVVGIDCQALIRQHGSLHCATMQFPVGIIAQD